MCGSRSKDCADNKPCRVLLSNAFKPMKVHAADNRRDKTTRGLQITAATAATPIQGHRSER